MAERRTAWRVMQHRRRLVQVVCLSLLLGAMPLMAAGLDIGLAQVQTQAGGAAERLQALSAAQASALAGGDGPTILASSRDLAAFAEQLLGDLAMEGRRPAEASGWYRGAWALEPTTATGLQLLTAELGGGDPAAATQTAAEIVGSAGDTAALRLALANAFHSAGDINGTIAQLTQAVALDPGNSAVHLALGNAFWELNESQYNADSLREFTEAQRLAPGNFFANYDLGALLSQYQRFDEAAAFLRLASTEDPASPDPSLQLGLNAYTQGHAAEARQALEQAVTLTGANVARNGYAIRRADSVLSRLATEAGEPEIAAQRAAAAEAVRQAMLRSGVSTTLTESSGLVTNPTPGGGPGGGSAVPRSAAADRTAAGQPTAEQASLVRQLEAVAARSLNDAGTVLARGHDYAGALPLFRQAAAADPTLPPVLRNLGLAAFHTGDLPAARKALESAVQMDPTDAVAARYLQQLRDQAPGP